MTSHHASSGNRRQFLIASGAALAGLALPGLAPLARAAERKLKIGVIGAGRIGGTVGAHWVRAGHEVLFSSRHPDRLKSLVEPLGPRARAGWPKEAASFGEVVLISVPYKAVPQVGRDFRVQLAGKVVLETGNPFPGRDGDMARAARAKGTALASRDFLPGVRLVRAFNTIPYWDVKGQAHRAGEKVAVPLVGDDKGALEVAKRLVRDAGFEPVVVGGLEAGKLLEPGGPVFAQALTARELRAKLGLPQR